MKPWCHEGPKAAYSSFVYMFSRALFTYEGNSNDIRVAGTGGEYDQVGFWGYQKFRDGGE